MQIFKKNTKIVVQGTSIAVLKKDDSDYISLTDMVKSQESDFVVKDWLRNRNTLEFLGLWEEMNNAAFNHAEFDEIKKEAGLNSFRISVKEWVTKTNAIGLIAQTGRYGGTYGHIDIAFEFGTWISPQFKLYLIKEYKRLKESDNDAYDLDWNVKRMVSKANYQIHTDAVKEHLVPKAAFWNKNFQYASEADLLNLAVFGCTAKEWRTQNPELAKSNRNVRDAADVKTLIVLSNIESLNAILIKEGVGKQERFEKLKAEAADQLARLKNYDSAKALKG